MNKKKNIELNENEDFYEHHRFRVDTGQGLLRIDKYLLSKLAHTSRHKIQLAAKSNCIIVNGAAVKSNYKVKPEDEISIVFPHPPPDTEVKPEALPLEIIYEDDDLIVVNKKAGMVVHPAYANYTGTLVNALLWHFNKLAEDKEGFTRPGLVHRIDKDTSGVLVIAKNDETMSFLAKQFFDHSIQRKYLALVWGDLRNDEGSITYRLKRDPKDRRKIAAEKNDGSGSGRDAITHYRVIERFIYTTLIECRLETGRTHQIRSHMKAVGHPIFNDETYGGASVLTGPAFSKYKQFIANCFELLPRQALHAKSLGFIHPSTRKFVFFDSCLPDDFQVVLEKWRRYVNDKF